MNDPVSRILPLGFIGGVIFSCACVMAYLVTLVLLVVIGVDGMIADSTGVAISWFIVLNRFSRAKTARMPRIVLGTLVMGFSRYAGLIFIQYLKSSAGK